MTQVSYPYTRNRSRRYSFVSMGKKRIEKVVDFASLGVGNMVNMAFGDLLPDGSIDDNVSSNNGDMIKVLATVVDILKHFTSHHPHFEIYFEGSTPARTKLYNRILRTYYHLFNQEFRIAGLVRVGASVKIVPYDRNGAQEYFAFLIKRIV